MGRREQFCHPFHNRTSVQQLLCEKPEDAATWRSIDAVCIKRLRENLPGLWYLGTSWTTLMISNWEKIKIESFCPCSFSLVSSPEGEIATWQRAIMLFSTRYVPGSRLFMWASSCHPTALFGVLFLFYRWENKLGNCNIFQGLMTVQKRSPVQPTGLKACLCRGIGKEYNSAPHPLSPTLEFEDSQMLLWFSELAALFSSL